MNKLVSFYDRYHQKNHQFHAVIQPGNFTYWYILEFLHQACTEGFAGKRVLDVGCGVGTISLYLAVEGAQVTGIDISHRAINIADQARKDIGLKNAVFIHGEVTSQPKRYDVITCFEVVEHVANDRAFVKKLYINLKPGGKLVLTTPSEKNLLYRLGFYTKFDQEVGHLRRYTQARLSAVLEKTGFTILQTRSVEGPLRNILFTTKLGFLIKGIKGPLVPIFHWFDYVSGLLFGFSDIQVIAQKL